MKKRSSDKVQFNIHVANEKDCVTKLNTPLFEWVIENLTKNAIDAMNGEGVITCNINANYSHVFIDISDTGKGINKNQYKTIFKPGFTTKKRGWGMGLSLVKRIIEDYHKGEIFVKQSEAEVGTTFRIILKKG